MNNKLSWALISLRISAILYYLMIVGFVMFAASLDLAEAWPRYFIAAFIVAFVVFLEFVIAHLKKGKFWAWVAGIAIGGLYTPSLFLPLGIFILIGLLSDESRRDFLDKKIRQDSAGRG